MNFIEQSKGLISRGEVQEASKNLIEDIINALLGDPISVGKIIFTLIKSPFFFREQLFWTKMEAFLNGVYLNEADKEKLRAKLNKNGKERDNACRLIECIDRAETQQKIRYLINATRCLLADSIDLQTYFRICHAIKNTLEEDLQFLREHILTEDNHGDSLYTEGLLTAGLMYQSVFDPNGNQKYSFNTTVELVDKFAVSYDDVARYPNPTSNPDKDYSHQISLSTGIETISKDEIDRLSRVLGEESYYSPLVTKLSNEGYCETE